MDFNAVVTAPQDMRSEEFADMISDEIMDNCEKRMIESIVRSEFPHLLSDDRAEVCAIAMREASPDSGEVINAIHYNRRRALIADEVLGCLNENHGVVLSGLINFRLSDYKNELRNLCFNAYDEYEAEREYNEFLEMLSFFVSVQSPREDTVYLVKRRGRLRILNRKKRDITDIYFSEFPAPPEGLTDEDIALSALISIAPLHIMVADYEENEKIYQTIKAIFSDVRFKQP